MEFCFIISAIIGAWKYNIAIIGAWKYNIGQIINSKPKFSASFFFLQGRFHLKNRQKPTATLIYTDNIIYNIYTTYIPPPPIINTFSDVKIHVSKVHVHQNSKR